MDYIVFICLFENMKKEEVPQQNYTVHNRDWEKKGGRSEMLHKPDSQESDPNQRSRDTPDLPTHACEQQHACWEFLKHWYNILVSTLLVSSEKWPTFVEAAVVTYHLKFL